MRAELDRVTRLLCDAVRLLRANAILPPAELAQWASEHAESDDYLRMQEAAARPAGAPVLVHALFSGRAICGFAAGTVPGRWPVGQQWLDVPTFDRYRTMLTPDKLIVAYKAKLCEACAREVQRVGAASRAKRCKAKAPSWMNVEGGCELDAGHQPPHKGYGGEATWGDDES